ncbi:MAG: hypothetical protein HC887_12840 [Desulfobacteraceae bacterium]|nr:hypothetical protein [Desulfobacteraceae bacterium]
MQDKMTQEQRPALTDKGLIGEIEETLAIRNPLYEQAADICVDTDDLDIGEIVGVLYLTFQKQC